MEPARVIIQIDRPSDNRLEMEDVRRMLAVTGIELDEGYGPILVNPKLGRYVVRGKAMPDARRRAEALEGVRLFADSRQHPMQR